MKNSIVEKLIKRVVATIAPPKKLTVSEWADQHRILSGESSSESGKYQTARTPYLKEIMDCANDNKVERIIFMKSSQVRSYRSLN